MVLSYEPDTMCLPSGENATKKTEPVCPWRGFPTRPPICTSQTWIMLLCEPDTIYLPSGENATDQTESVSLERVAVMTGSPRQSGTEQRQFGGQRDLDYSVLRVQWLRTPLHRKAEAQGTRLSKPEKKGTHPIRNSRGIAARVG